MAKRIYQGYTDRLCEDKNKNILSCQDVTVDNFTQEELNGAIQLEIETLGTFCSHIIQRLSRWFHTGLVVYNYNDFFLIQIFYRNWNKK